MKGELLGKRALRLVVTMLLEPPLLAHVRLRKGVVVPTSRYLQAPVFI